VSRIPRGFAQPPSPASLPSIQWASSASIVPSLRFRSIPRLTTCSSRSAAAGIAAPCRGDPGAVTRGTACSDRAKAGRNARGSGHSRRRALLETAAQPVSIAGVPRPLLALLLLVPVPTLGLLAGMAWWPESGVGQALFLLSKLWILLFPALWHRWVEKERWSLSPAREGGFTLAAVTGVAIAGLIFGAYALVRQLGWVDVDVIRAQAAATGLDRRAIYLAGAIYWITANSLIEEYVWRWFVFRQFERLIGGKAAVVASALGFTLPHVFALGLQFDWRVTTLASLGVFIGGLIWSWLYLRQRSVWPCWLSHAIVDVPIFLIGWWLIFPAG